MFDWIIGGAGDLFGLVGGAVGSAVGWAWDKVTSGIYTWLANGLALLIEWVWSVLDSQTTPRVTDGWFANDLAVQVGLLGLASTIAMMLASAAQAALAGRPEQIGDAVRNGIGSIVASALTVTVVDVLIRVVDEASAMVWQSSRGDLVTTLERLVFVATTTGPLASTFVGPLCLLFGFLGLLGLTVSLMMRSALIYLVAAMAPIVWSANVLPTFRGSARKLIHLTVSLVLSKLVIVIALAVSLGLLANPSGDPDSGSIINDGAAAVGTLISGFVCFVIAAVTPVLLYKLMPTVEGAVASTGITGSWGRTVTTAAHTALMVKSLGASAATRQVAPGNTTHASTPRGGIAGLTGVPSGTTGSTSTGAGTGATGTRAAPGTGSSTPPSPGSSRPSGSSTRVAPGAGRTTPTPGGTGSNTRTHAARPPAGSQRPPLTPAASDDRGEDQEGDDG